MLHCTIVRKQGTTFCNVMSLKCYHFSPAQLAERTYDNHSSSDALDLVYTVIILVPLFHGSFLARLLYTYFEFLCWCTPSLEVRYQEHH